MLDLKSTTRMTMGNTSTVLIFLNLEQDGSEWSASRSSYFVIRREPVRPVQTKALTGVLSRRRNEIYRPKLLLNFQLSLLLHIKQCGYKPNNLKTGNISIVCLNIFHLKRKDHVNKYSI